MAKPRNEKEQPEARIGLSDVLWGLLDQWKAMLLCAVLAAVLVPSIKFAKDSISHKQKLASEQGQSQQVEVVKDESIEQVLAELKEEDASAIKTILQQQQLADMQTEYLDSSVLLNLDPTNQRTLYLGYRLDCNEGVDLASLCDAYSVLLKKDSRMDSLGKVLNLDADSDYIYELVSISNSSIPDSETRSAILSVSIVLPEDADAAVVADAVDEYVKQVQAELPEGAGGHAINRFSQNDVKTYNSDAINRRTSLVSDINYYHTQIKTAVAALNDEQKDAYNRIVSILEAQKASKTDELSVTSDSANALAKVEQGDGEQTADKQLADAQGQEVESPKFSFKFVLVGFVFGVVAYAVCYVLLLFVRGRVESAGALADYTSTRLLGEVYQSRAPKGLDRLFHSRIVGKMRFGKYGNEEEQVKRTIATASSVCAHAGTNDIHILRVCGDQNAVEVLASSFRAHDISADILTIDNDFDERELLPVHNAIMCVDASAKASTVWNLVQLCAEYDITCLGCVYTRAY